MTASAPSSRSGAIAASSTSPGTSTSTSRSPSRPTRISSSSPPRRRTRRKGRLSRSSFAIRTPGSRRWTSASRVATCGVTAASRSRASCPELDGRVLDFDPSAREAGDELARQGSVAGSHLDQPERKGTPERRPELLERDPHQPREHGMHVRARDEVARGTDRRSHVEAAGAVQGLFHVVGERDRSLLSDRADGCVRQPARSRRQRRGVAREGACKDSAAWTRDCGKPHR